MRLTSLVVVLGICLNSGACRAGYSISDGCSYDAPTVRSEYMRADFVFVGRLSPLPTLDEGAAFDVDVLRVFKGQPPPTMTLTFGGRRSPPEAFQPGQDHLLFVNQLESSTLYQGAEAKGRRHEFAPETCGNSVALGEPSGKQRLDTVERLSRGTLADFAFDERGRLSGPTLLALLGGFVGLLTLLNSYFTRRSEQRWKRADYVQRAFQERYDSPGAKNASFLLYWKDRHIPLWADDEKNRWTRVNDHEAARAILPYCIHPFTFQGMPWKSAKRRIALNDSFVDLIWRLDHVRVVSRAAHPEDVREIVHELGEILEGRAAAKRLAPTDRLVPSAFKLMIAWRGMRDLVSFFDDHGYDIRYQQRDHDMLTAAFPEASWPKLQIEEVSKLQPPRRPALKWGPAGLLQRIGRLVSSALTSRTRHAKGA